MKILAGFAVVFLANLLAMFVVRAFISKKVGIAGVPFRVWSEPPASFERAWPLARELVAVACALVPYLTAVALFTTGSFLQGETTTGHCVDVKDKGPAARGGMRSGDCIESVDATPVDRFEDIVLRVRPHGGDKLSIRVRRADEAIDLEITPAGPPDAGSLGVIGTDRHHHDISLVTALAQGIGRPFVAIAFVGRNIAKSFEPKSPPPPIPAANSIDETRAMPEEERGGYFGALGGADTVVQWPVLLLVMLVVLPRRSKPRDVTSIGKTRLS